MITNYDFRKYRILASYSSRGPSKFNQISDGPQNGVKMTATYIDEFTIYNYYPHLEIGLKKTCPWDDGTILE